MSSDCTNTSFRLTGIEPDNPLAFLALMGTMQALLTANATRSFAQQWEPRVSWDFDPWPLRPRLHAPIKIEASDLVKQIEIGLDILAPGYQFSGRKLPDFRIDEARTLFRSAARSSSTLNRAQIDVLSSIVTDAASRAKGSDEVAPSPLCFQLGSGHQYFLERLSALATNNFPAERPQKRCSNNSINNDPISATLFQEWNRMDDLTHSLRWDPKEDARYALLPGDPSIEKYKGHTQLGANRLAAIGLSVLTLVAHRGGRKVQPSILGGNIAPSQAFSLAWPIWHDAISLPTIKALLSHPRLRYPKDLQYLGVEHVFEAQRIHVGKFMNFSQARPLN